VAFEFRGGPGDNGNLETSIGPLNQTSTDKPGDATYTTNIMRNDCPCGPYITNLLNTSNQINSSNLPYNSLTNNSNAAASTGIENMQLPVPNLPGWLFPTPGWGRQLPLGH
jgi:hypothetical protein